MANNNIKSAAGTSSGTRDAPTNIYTVDSDGNFTTNTGTILGPIFTSIDLTTLLPPTANMVVTRFELVEGTGILKVYGSNSRVIGYALDEDADETNSNAWVLETLTRRGNTYTYIVTGFSEAFAGLGNTRGELRRITKYSVKPRDTLVKIAQHILHDGRRWREIYQMNRVTIGNDPTVLPVHTILRIPKR
jgi:nucleoid-associated protein YgaU